MKASGGTGGEKPLVLVVDDNDDNREMYATYLAYQGCRVDTAASGVEGLMKAMSLKPDLVLLDLGMPGIDGWEVARELKQRPETRGCTVVAVTAHVFPGDEQRAIAAGVDGFVRKPVTPLDLYNRVGGILRELQRPLW